jgi:hypothetical protein
MQLTIKQLRQKGYKVRVMHHRHLIKVQKIMGVAHEISARGGSTTIEVSTPDKQHHFIGKAVCSLEDNFNKKVGNSIALGRALRELFQAHPEYLINF